MACALYSTEFLYRIPLIGRSRPKKRSTTILVGMTPISRGSLVSFFIPIVFGFDWFFVFATVIFWATAIATYLFFRNPPGIAVGN